MASTQANETPRKPCQDNRDEGSQRDGMYVPPLQSGYVPIYRPFDHGAIHDYPGAWPSLLAHTLARGSHSHPHADARLSFSHSPHESDVDLQAAPPLLEITMGVVTAFPL